MIKLLVLYKGYNFKEKLILHQLYLFLRGFYLKELYNIKMSLNANNLSHNGIMNSYLVIIYLNWSKIIDLIELNFFVIKEKKFFQTRFNQRVSSVFIIYKIVRFNFKQLHKSIYCKYNREYATL